MKTIMSGKCINSQSVQLMNQSYIDQMAGKRNGCFVLAKNASGENIYEWMDCHFEELSSWKLWEILSLYRACSVVDEDDVVAQIEAALKIRGDFNGGTPWVRPSEAVDSKGAMTVYQ
jgi:hypothetical protein